MSFNYASYHHQTYYPLLSECLHTCIAGWFPTRLKIFTEIFHPYYLTTWLPYIFLNDKNVQKIRSLRVILSNAMHGEVLMNWCRVFQPIIPKRSHSALTIVYSETSQLILVTNHVNAIKIGVNGKSNTCQKHTATLCCTTIIFHYCVKFSLSLYHKYMQCVLWFGKLLLFAIACLELCEVLCTCSVKLSTPPVA